MNYSPQIGTKLVSCAQRLSANLWWTNKFQSKQKPLVLWKKRS
jgi:hypothetical protein